MDLFFSHGRVAFKYGLIQLGFNLIWTTLFFKLKRPLLALVDIVLMTYFAYITQQAF